MKFASLSGLSNARNGFGVNISRRLGEADRFRRQGS